MTFTDVLIDFGIASVLILIGQLLRSKVSFFQQFYIPSSMIAGFIAVILGKQFLNILPFSGYQGSYTGVLVILVFTIIGINGFESSDKQQGKNVFDRVVSYVLYRNVGYFMQIGIPIAVTLLLLTKIYPDLNPGFGILFSSGFLGGHGTAAAVGKTFSEYGWEDAMDVGMTFATLGILTGIFGGLAIIKIAAKKGHTALIKDISQVDPSMRTGLIAPADRKPMGNETISSVSLDTLCFHMAQILALAAAGQLLNTKLAAIGLSGIPSYTVAFLLAFIYFMVFRKTGVYKYVDRRINTRISGMVTDYLVFFGIASINLGVVVKYWGPILISLLVGFAVVLVNVYPLGHMMNNKCWFERSIFYFGMMTGVFAIGLILLRIVDPENKSLTLDDFAMGPFLSFAEVAIWSTFPTLLITGHGWIVAGICALVTVASIVLAFVGKMWYTTPIAARGSFSDNN